MFDPFSLILKILTVLQSLLKDGQSFSRLIEEFGSAEEEEGKKDEGEDDQKKDEGVKKLGPSKPGAALMTEEERETGAVSSTVYKRYLKHAGSVLWGPAVIIFVLLMQGASGENLMLSWVK